VFFGNTGVAVKTNEPLMRKNLHLVFAALILILACNLPTGGQVPATDSPAPAPAESATVTVAPPPTAAVVHVINPAGSFSTGFLAYDVESKSTAPEKRAPYGDSYDINRLERPFLQDMTYIPDLDIERFSLTSDENWFYISINLIGADPNNAMGIQYGVELDQDRDGFGDFIILGRQPFTPEWSADNVQVFADKSHDTSAVSSIKSDAPTTTDGYETLIFDGGRGPGDDPDLAWVRINAGDEATVQFAFKRTLVGSSFMYGAIADAGLKDVGKLDYVDRFTEAEAGSPVKDKLNYPLKALYAVDNTCREAFGFSPTGYEPQLCPRNVAVPGTREPDKCENPSQYTSQSSCEAAGCHWVQNTGVLILVVYHCVQ
jgi:hypothetical protein